MAIQDDEIWHRLCRLYAAIDSTEECDLEKFKANIISSKIVVAVYQDFRGGRSSEELQNACFTLIYASAHLYDHIRKWAKGLGRLAVASALIEGSAEIKLVRDLADSDKHGGVRSDGGYSGRAPRLGEINSVMRLSTGSAGPSSIVMTIGRGGQPEIQATGGASARVVITADVLDADGARIGDIRDIVLKAVDDWENVVRSVKLPSTP